MAAIGMIVAGLVSIMLTGGPAKAVGSFNNAGIADAGLREVGTSRPTGWNQPGECIKSAQRWVAAAGGYLAPGGVISGYTKSGAREVSLAEAAKGDIIQYTNANGNDSDWTYVHTVAVVTNYGNGRFDIVQSNSPAGSGLVTRNTNWVPTPHAGWVARVWRLGAVYASGPTPRDLDGDGRADLIIAGTANTGSGRLEVHAMSASSGYTNWMLHVATPHGYLDSTQRLVMGDANNDGRADLVVVNTGPTGSGRLEAHVLNGASGFGAWSLHAATAAGYGSPTDRYTMGDVNGDGYADLIIVGTANTGSGRLEAHVLNGATSYTSWLAHWATACGYIGPTDRVVAGDVNGDRRADLTIVGTSNTGSGRLEAHTLDAATGYGSWMLHAATPHGYIRDADRVAMSDVDGDGRADLSIIGTGPTGSGRLEAHVLSGSSGFNTWRYHWATAAGYIGSSDISLMAG